ncbi:hypothetical protein HPC38_09820 [Pasteurellaceae bacterium HPA106]|uniref:hypothetical protein n=1 Tax=Spirabiliibacterium pneumoniae TaxID=221400 RepID=UPI001AADD7B4|nr:hypothetical protein [Spirabiliibacterium pneumoniae]MBE2897161.1 hypothetical protein [Spirabiliibacterium pneumoniae]
MSKYIKCILASILIVIIEYPCFSATTYAATPRNYNPVEEFNSNTYTYNNDGAGKAQGIKFSLKIPKSWEAKDGNRPHVVKKFINKQGDTFAVYLVLIHSIPDLDDPDIRLSKSDIKEFLSDENNLKDFVPNNAQILGSGPITLETLNGFWLKTKIYQERLGYKIDMYSTSFVIPYKGKLIILQGIIPNQKPGKSISKKEMDIYELAFYLITNSLVLPEIYK